MSAVRADGPLIGLAATNVSDALANVSGGLQRGARLLDKLDLTATYTGDNHGEPGLAFFLDLQATDSTDFSSTVVGDAQVISSVDAPAGARVFNAWAAKDFDGRGGFKAGIIDLNSELDVQQTGALFLNGGHGIGPDFSQAGQNGPSVFPSTGLGFVSWWLPADHWQLKAAVFEGTPGDPAHPGQTSLSLTKNEGALLVFEVRNRPTPDFVVGLGTWRYTASFDAIDPAVGRISGNAGLYAIADGTLYAAPGGNRAGLAGWVRAGIADDRINPIDSTIAGGLVYTAPFGREADQVGIAFGYAHYGAPARRAGAAGGAPLGAAETSIELTYSFAFSEALIVQPDIQYVISPSADSAVADALVAGSRITVAW